MIEEIIKTISTEDKIYTVQEILIREAIKNIGDPFRNLTVKDIMKDLLVSEATANAIFKRSDFPSVNIGKTKTVTLLAYLVWKMNRKENEVVDNGKTE